MILKRIRENRSTILVIIVFVLGLLILNYPVLSTVYNQYRENQLMSAYENTVNKTPQESLKVYKEEGQGYNALLAGEGMSITDGFSPEREEDAQYLNILDMETSGVMGTIEIPKIHVYLPIYHGSSSKVLERGIGHLEGSSFPIGGASTHAILTGHRGLPQAELFTDLDKIHEGDYFYVHILNETLAYEVYGIETIEPQNVESLQILKGRDLVTLVTCTPYGVNTHRLLIHGERVKKEEKVQGSKAETRRNSLLRWVARQTSFLITTGFFVFILLFVLYRFVRNRWKKHRG